MAWTIIGDQWNFDGGGRYEVDQPDTETCNASKLYQDNESGEKLGIPVFVLGYSSSRNAISNQDRSNYPFPYQQLPRLLQGQFRIGNALRWMKLLQESTKGPANFGLKRITKRRQTFSFSPGNLRESGQLNDYGFSNETDTNVVINIWEEFKYGSAILNHKSSTPMNHHHGGCEWVRPIIRKFFPKNIVDYILYILFFVIYFVSCLLYNNYLSLGFLLLYDLHLRIHENADKCNIKVRFKGSAFQGPMYCIIRMLCHHCEHDETDKIMLKLMRRMKEDITSKSST